MPQWRRLHVSLLESWHLHAMPDDFTRLLWLLLPLVLDREGRGIDLPTWVRAKVFPLRSDVTDAQVAAALDWFAGRGLIRRYRAGEERYFCVPDWHELQGGCEREAPSRYPAPPEPADGEVPAQTPADGASPAHEPSARSRPGHEQVTSCSAVPHEQLVRPSCVRHALDSDSDSDSDIETDSRLH